MAMGKREISGAPIHQILMRIKTMPEGLVPLRQGSRAAVQNMGVSISKGLGGVGSQRERQARWPGVSAVGVRVGAALSQVGQAGVGSTKAERASRATA